MSVKNIFAKRAPFLFWSGLIWSGILISACTNQHQGPAITPAQQQQLKELDALKKKANDSLSAVSAKDQEIQTREKKLQQDTLKLARDVETYQKNKRDADKQMADAVAARQAADAHEKDLGDREKTYSQNSQQFQAEKAQLIQQKAAADAKLIAAAEALQKVSDIQSSIESRIAEFRSAFPDIQNDANGAMLKTLLATNGEYPTLLQVISSKGDVSEFDDVKNKIAATIDPHLRVTASSSLDALGAAKRYYFFRVTDVSQLDNLKSFISKSNVLVPTFFAVTKARLATFAHLDFAPTGGLLNNHKDSIEFYVGATRVKTVGPIYKTLDKNNNNTALDDVFLWSGLPVDCTTVSTACVRELRDTGDFFTDSVQLKRFGGLNPKTVLVSNLNQHIATRENSLIFKKDGVITNLSFRFQVQVVAETGETLDLPWAQTVVSEAPGTKLDGILTTTFAGDLKTILTERPTKK